MYSWRGFKTMLLRRGIARLGNNYSSNIWRVTLIHAQETYLLGLLNNMSPWRAYTRQGSIVWISPDRPYQSTPRRHPK